MRTLENWRKRKSLTKMDRLTKIVSDQDLKNVQFTFTQTNNQLVMSTPNTHTHIMLFQLNMKDGIKAYCTRGGEDIVKDVKQLLLCQGTGVKCHMTKEKSLIIWNDPKIKKRWDNKSTSLCGWTINTDKEEASSPKVSIEIMMLSCAIDARKIDI